MSSTSNDGNFGNFGSSFGSNNNNMNTTTTSFGGISGTAAAAVNPFAATFHNNNNNNNSSGMSGSNLLFSAPSVSSMTALAPSSSSSSISSLVSSQSSLSSSLSSSASNGMTLFGDYSNNNNNNKNQQKVENGKNIGGFKQQQQQQVMDMKKKSQKQRNVGAVFTNGVGSALTTFDDKVLKHFDTSHTLDDELLRSQALFRQESAIHFKSLQESRLQCQNMSQLSQQEIFKRLNSWRVKILQVSATYRSLLYALFSTGGSGEKEKRRDLVQLKRYATVCAQTIHLIEILYLSTVDLSSAQLAVLLLDWIRRTTHVNLAEMKKKKKSGGETVGKEKEQAKKLELISMLMKGQFKDLIPKMNDYFGTVDVPFVGEVLELLNQIPHATISMNSSYLMNDEFVYMFQEWNTQVCVLVERMQQRLEQRANGTNGKKLSDLITMVQIMSGDQDVVRELRRHHAQHLNQLDQLAAYILYSDPMISIDTLPFVMSEILGTEPDEYRVFHLLLQNPTNILLNISKLAPQLGHWWTLHVCDLVWHCEHFKILDQRSFGEWFADLDDMRENALMDYGLTLFSNETSRNTAIMYSKYSKRSDLAELLLSMIPLESERESTVLDHCKQIRQHFASSDPSLVQSIRRVWAMHAIKQKNNFTAGIDHLLRANEDGNNEQIISSVTNHALRMYMDSVTLAGALQGDMGNASILQSLTRSNHHGDRSDLLEPLKFFVEYSESKQIHSLLNIFQCGDVFIPRTFKAIVLALAVHHLTRGEEVDLYNAANGDSRTIPEILLTELQDLTMHPGIFGPETSKEVMAMRFFLGEKMTECYLR